MKRQWETEELIDHWTLNVEELAQKEYDQVMGRFPIQ